MPFRDDVVFGLYPNRTGLGRSEGVGENAPMLSAAQLTVGQAMDEASQKVVKSLSWSVLFFRMIPESWNQAR